MNSGTGSGTSSVAVIGARGRTGACVVAEAARRGLPVVAVTRSAAAGVAEPTVPPGARAATADALDPDALTVALAGCDAVISAVGIGLSRARTSLFSDGARALIVAMEANGIRRIVAVAAQPAAPRASHPPLQRLVVLPLLERVFGGTYADMRRMQATLAASGLEWTVVLPPRLTSGGARGAYRLGNDIPDTGSLPLAYADLATALLDVAADPALAGRSVAVAGARG